MRHSLNVASSICVHLWMCTLLAHLLPSFLPPCVHLSGHFMSCSCYSVQIRQGGISLRQMVDDVAPILSEESGQCCVLSTPHLNLPQLVHMSLSPGSSPLPGQIPQAINPENHTISQGRTFSAWLVPVGIKPQKHWQCLGLRTFQDTRHMTTSRTWILQKGNAYRTVWRNTN